MKKLENILYLMGGTSSIIGFGGLAGYSESGHGLILSLILTICGLYSCIWSMRLEKERRKREYFRIDRISYKR